MDKSIVMKLNISKLAYIEELICFLFILFYGVYLFYLNLGLIKTILSLFPFLLYIIVIVFYRSLFSIERVIEIKGETLTTKSFLGKKKNSIKLNDTNNISIKVPLMGKIFKYGTLCIKSDNSLIIYYLKKPEEAKTNILLTIKRKKEIS